MRRSRVAAVLSAGLGMVLFGALVGAGPILADDSVDRTLRDPRISESSGLVASTVHPGVVWTHNDSGHPPQLFAVGLDGSTLATVTVAGAQARDWEALASGRAADGRPLLWVGDIGDNRSVRPYVRLYRVLEPDRLADATVPSTEYRLRYPDGAHDAEALLVDPRTQAMYVVTKAVSGAAVFELPRAPRPAPAVNVLIRVADAPPVVTDGAFAPDGTRLVLVGYLAGTMLAQVGGPGSPVRLPLRPQGESVTWADPTHLLVGSEGTGSHVWRVALPLVGASPRPGTPPLAPPAVAPVAAAAPSGAGSAVVGSALAAALVTGLMLYLLRRLRRSRSADDIDTQPGRGPTSSP